MSRFYEYPDYLCHYGVKGQKWGVRRYQNYDGTLTDEGKRQLRKDVDKAYHKKNVTYSERNKLLNKRSDVMRELHESLKEKRAAYEQADYLSREFHSNHGLFNTYLKKAHAQDVIDWGEDPDDMFWIETAALDYTEGTMDSRIGGKAFQLYLKDNGVNPRQYMDNVRKAYDDYMDECSEFASTVLGDMANTPVNGVDRKYSSAVSSALINMADKDWNDRYLYTKDYDF